MTTVKPLVISSDLHRRVKRLAADSGVSLKDVSAILLEYGLDQHSNGGIAISGPAITPRAKSKTRKGAAV